MNKFKLLLTSSLCWATVWTVAPSAMAGVDDVAIIIGNKDYEDQDIPAVEFAHNDAQAMRAFVENVLNIADENIIYLEDATQAKMQSAFGRDGNYRGKAFQYVKPDVSNLYVFYSGHGMPGQHDQKSYLLPVDAEIETTDINGYPIDLLYKNLSQIGAKSVTVFLDACFSGNSHAGSLIQKASGARISAAPTSVPKTQSNQITVLTAASKDQLASWDEENKHGLFTEYLLRALYGEADSDQDGQVRLGEVETFLKTDMRHKARRQYNRDQIPDVQGADDNLVLVAAVDGSFPKRPQIAKDTASASFELDDQPEINVQPVDKLYPVETRMFTLKNANVRAKPTIYSQKVLTLPKGESVYVAAKIMDQPWYAIEKDEKIIGYVFADLLGEQETITASRENKSIRDLKERLQKLEEQSGQKDTQASTPKVIETVNDVDIVERSSERIEPATSWRDPDQVDVLGTLKRMGAILAKQSFIKNYREDNQRTSLHYNWIKVDEAACALEASLSLNHGVNYGRSINIHDRLLNTDFKSHLKRKRRVLKVRDEDGDVMHRSVLFQYGPFVFKERHQMVEFIDLAKSLINSCRSNFHSAENIEERETRPERDNRPPPFLNDRSFPPKTRDFPRRPPPPRR